MKSFIILLSAIFSFQALAQLNEVSDFGVNKGSLRMFVYTPKNLKTYAPLIVLLHGCTQSASSMDDETGFAHIAEKTGSVLLIPEQPKYNNYSRCYNWFLPTDFLRGEAKPLQLLR